jgi:hypothetical protein
MLLHDMGYPEIGISPSQGTQQNASLLLPEKETDLVSEMLFSI